LKAPFKEKESVVGSLEYGKMMDSLLAAYTPFLGEIYLPVDERLNTE